MSTAAAFRHHRPFPFCPPDFDIDALAAADYDHTQLFIRDLTLADAMALYWNTETVRVKFNVTGAVFGVETVDVAFDEVHAAVSPRAPRSRVCNSGDNQPVLSARGTEVNGLTITVGGVPSSQDYRLDLDFCSLLSPGSPLPGKPVSRQTDGLYTFWFLLSPLEGYLFPGSDGTAGAVNDIIGSATVSVLSGSLVLKALRETGGSGGSVGTLDFIPSFYTY